MIKNYIKIAFRNLLKHKLYSAINIFGLAVAFVLAVPLAWYAMSKWLQDFAYKVNLGTGVFLLAGLITLVIAWLTISYQTAKATMINPVESLRSE